MRLPVTRTGLVKHGEREKPIVRIIKNCLVACMAMVIAALICVLLIVGGLSVALKSGPVEMPRARLVVQDLLNDRMQDLTLDVGAVALRSDDGAPGNQLQLRDVTLTDTTGAQILKLADVRTSYALSDLVRGRISPSDIMLVGTELRLRRDTQGRIDFFALNSGAGDIDLLDAFYKMTARPELKELQRVDLSGARVVMTDDASGRTWAVDDTTLTLAKSEDGAFVMKAALALADEGEAATNPAVLRLTADVARDQEDIALGFQFEDADPTDVADLFQAFDWLRNIEAQVSGSIRAALDQDGRLSGFSGVLDLGKGQLNGTPDSTPVTFTTAKVYFTYDQASEQLNLQGVEAETSSGTLKGEGFVQLARQADGTVTSLAGQLRFNEIKINRPDLFDADVQLAGASLDARLSFQPLRLEVGQLSIFDSDTIVRATGSSVAEKAFWVNRYDVDITAIDHTRLTELWPKVVEPKTRTWILEYVSAGRATNLRGGLRSEGGKMAFALNFDVEGADARFLETVPNLKDGRGFGYLTQDSFRLDITDGRVVAGDGTEIAVAGSSLYIPDIRKKPTPGEITLKATGGLTAALHVLNSDKFRFIDKVNQTPDVASGRVEASGTFRLPLHKETTFEQVDLDVRAKVFDLASDTLIKGRSLRGRALDVHAKTEGVQLGGLFELDGIPVDATWTQPFGKTGENGSTIAAELDLNDANLRAFEIALPPGTVQGSARGRVDIALKNGQVPQYVLTSDLLGARLSIPAIGWAKGANASGNLQLSGTLGDRPTVDDLSISGGGLSANGRLNMTPSGKLARADFTDLKIGNWLDTSASLVPRPNGGSEIALRGGALDLRNYKPGNSGGGSGRSVIRADLDRLTVTQQIALTSFRADLVTSGGLSGKFTARVNGGADIQGEVFPQPNGTALELTSNNAGGVLNSAGLLKNAKWGDMRVVIVPRPGRGNYDGTLKIENTRLRSVSAMADLLNAISLVGLVQQLNGSGIHFSTVEGQFALRDQGVQLKNISAVGPSMGMTLDGWYYANRKTVDFEGVTTPLYAINGMLERIFGVLVGRRKGEGMFSFTYRMRGSADNPKVSVNPLSVLTPGAFREIFRQNAPEPPASFAPVEPNTSERLSTSSSPAPETDTGTPTSQSQSKKIQEELR